MTKPELQRSTAKPYCLQAIERHGAITKLTMTLSPDLVYLRFSSTSGQPLLAKTLIDFLAAPPIPGIVLLILSSP
jgi:hypothetical protein